MRALLLALITLQISAQSDWTLADTALEAAIVTLFVADWGQTLDVQNRLAVERNPVLGGHPSRAAVNRYFATGIVAHALLMKALPPRHRRWAQYLTIGLESACIVHNGTIRAGIKIRF